MEDRPRQAGGSISLCGPADRRGRSTDGTGILLWRCDRYRSRHRTAWPADHRAAVWLDWDSVVGDCDTHADGDGHDPGDERTGGARAAISGVRHRRIVHLQPATDPRL